MTEDFLDALFLSTVCSGLKCYPSRLDTTGIRVCNFRNFLTARRVLTANLVFNDVDLFRSPIALRKQILD